MLPRNGQKIGSTNISLYTDINKKYDDKWWELVEHEPDESNFWLNSHQFNPSNPYSSN